MFRYFAAALLTLGLSGCFQVGTGTSPDMFYPLEDLHVEEPLKYSNSPIDNLLSTDQSHFVRVLEDGDEALVLRIHLIRQAKRSINIQTFIWRSDETGRFVLAELVAAAKRGVKVRIIVDELVNERDPELVAAFAREYPEVEIKHYNPPLSKVKPSVLDLLRVSFLEFKALNQRMHNKVFVVDDRFAILGGRNYENEYYERGEELNFIDRDVLVTGPVVSDVTDSFGQYWAYKAAIRSSDLIDVKRAVADADLTQLFKPSKIFSALTLNASDADYIEKNFVKPALQVKKVTFVADIPGKNDKLGLKGSGDSTAALVDFIQSAKQSLTLQTPYLVIGRRGVKFLEKLRDTNPELDIRISTNSLAATDSLPAYAFSYKLKKEYLRDAKLRIFELKREDSTGAFPCIHAKSFVADNRRVWIGSFNLDMRSANLNTEVGLIIDDQRVAQAVKSEIEKIISPARSWTIGRRRNLPVVSHFSYIVSELMDILPFLDIWPYRYSESFELLAGKEELPFYHPDFYASYRAVGSFPGASAPEAQIKARLIKAFFKEAKPLM